MTLPPRSPIAGLLEILACLETDIAVVGAGPSGSACAALLADRGYDVALIDQYAFPRDKPCGDGLVPDTVETLKALGLDSMLVSSQVIDHGRLIVDHRRERIKHFTDGAAVCVPRAQMDKALLDVATSRGARFIQAKALAVKTEDDSRRAVVELSVGDQRSTVVARRVVASDGSTSRIRRSAGLGSPGHAVRAWAIRGYYATERPLEGSFDVYVPLELNGITLVGYGWVFAIGPNLANIGVGYFRPRGVGHMPRLNKALDAFVNDLRRAEDRRYGDLEPVGRSAGAPLGVNFSRSRSATHNMLLIGDAAGTTDPLTGEGIGPALHSGIAGALSVSREFERSKLDSRRYGTDLARLLPRTGQDLSCIARLSRSRTDDRAMSGSQVGHLGYFSSLLAVASHTGRRDDRADAIVEQLQRLEHPLAGTLDACIETTMDVTRTSFPFMSSVIAGEMSRGAGPLLSAVLTCTMQAFGGPSSERVAIGAAAAECLAPFATMLGLANPDRDGEATRLNNALAILTADFLLAQSFKAAATVGADTAARFARTVRAVCQGGAIDAADRYDLSRQPERLLAATEYKVGAAFAFAASTGVELTDDPYRAARLADFGAAVGVAYHLADSVRQIQAIGKTRSHMSSSLKRGIYSLPVLFAAQEDGVIRRWLTRGVERHELSTFVARLASTCGLPRTREIIDYRLDAAKEIVKDYDQRSAGLQSLVEWVSAYAVAKATPSSAMEPLLKGEYHVGGVTSRHEPA